MNSNVNINSLYSKLISFLSTAFYEGKKTRSSDHIGEVLNNFIKIIEYDVKNQEGTSFCWLLLYLFEPKFQEELYSKLFLILQENFTTMTVESFQESLNNACDLYQITLKPFTEFEHLLTNHKSLMLIAMLTVYVKERNSSQLETVQNLTEKSQALVTKILEKKSLKVLLKYCENGGAYNE